MDTGSEKGNPDTHRSPTARDGIGIVNGMAKLIQNSRVNIDDSALSTETAMSDNCCIPAPSPPSFSDGLTNTG